LGSTASGWQRRSAGSSSTLSTRARVPPHWFRVTDTRGLIENSRVSHWQVTIELGFTLD
jgi:flavin-binding protein dodecin